MSVALVNRSFRVNGVVVGGLTRYLARFWSTRPPGGEAAAPRASAVCDNATDGCGLAARAAPAVSRAARMARGRRVDARVAQGVRWTRELALTPLQLSVSSPRRPAWLAGLAAGPARRGLQRWLAHGCLHARLVFGLMHKLGLRPVATQTACAHRALGLATACDLVCADARGRRVIVELKACSERAMHVSSGRMRGALADLEDTPLQRALVQLCATRAFFARTHPTQPLSERAFVFYVHDSRAAAFALPARLLRSRLF